MRKFWIQRSGLLLASGLMMALAGHAHADSISTLFGTGLNDDGSLASSQSVDQHYTLVTNPAGAAAGGSASSAYVISNPPSTYVSNTSSSQFIGPRPSNASLLPGNYDYQTTFNLASYDLTTVSIKGMLAADNSVEIYLNGADTHMGAPGFTSFKSFMITNGFVSGLNTLDFIVNNSGTSNSPTGLQVQVSGTAAVPEPSSLVLCGLAGVVGSVYAWRRKARQVGAVV